MFSMSINRFLIFAAVIVAVLLIGRQCWQSYSAAEKWLYLFERSARDYAGQVLSSNRGTHIPVPEELSGSVVTVHETYLTFSPKQDPNLVLAFSPSSKPAANGSNVWVPVRDGWYVLTSDGRLGAAGK